MLIAGIDEVGRGPLAGPVVAAAVVFEKEYTNPEIKDSKKLSPLKREQLLECIYRDALQWAISTVSPQDISELNIREATRLAMSQAAAQINADLLLIDGNMEIDSDTPQRTVINGDTTHVAISAASIIAKVYRDHLMQKFDLKYPGYGFAHNAGYGTASHLQAIKDLGPSPIHRSTFRGVREYWATEICGE